MNAYIDSEYIVKDLIAIHGVYMKLLRCAHIWECAFYKLRRLLSLSKLIVRSLRQRMLPFRFCFYMYLYLSCVEE